MTKQRKQFSPHIYQEWGELFDAISTEERSEILLGITKFPEYEPKNVTIWNFIKSQLKKDYENFVEKCKSNSTIIKNYWNKKKQKDTNEYERITNENECIPKRITNNELLLTKTETKNNQDEIQLESQDEIQDDKKEKYKKEIEILCHLNKVAKRQFKTSNKMYIAKISKWLKEYSQDEIQDMILYKTKEWLNDKQMCKYLRPDTLFSNKLPTYIEESKTYGQRDVNKGVERIKQLEQESYKQYEC